MQGADGPSGVLLRQAHSAATAPVRARAAGGAAMPRLIPLMSADARMLEDGWTPDSPEGGWVHDPPSIWAPSGALDRASPNFMGLASLGLEIAIFSDFLYSVLLLDAILGLDFLGLAFSRSQAPSEATASMVADGWTDKACRSLKLRRA